MICSSDSEDDDEETIPDAPIRPTSTKPSNLGVPNGDSIVR